MTVWFPDGVVVVRGGNGGLGAACATLAAEDCNVALTYRSNWQRAQAVVTDLHARGRQACASALDLCDLEAVTTYLDTIVSGFDAFTVVYAAGPAIEMSYISDLRSEEWAWTPNQDVNDCFNLMKTALGTYVSTAAACARSRRMLSNGFLLQMSFPARQKPRSTRVSATPSSMNPPTVRSSRRSKKFACRGRGL